VGWALSLVLVTVASGCQPKSAGTPIPDAESRPEGVGRVIKVEANEPIGYRLYLEDGLVLTLEPTGTRTAVQTTNGPDSLAVYGHDEHGLWVVWLALDPARGPDCYALPRIGYDRAGFIGWPNDGFALPKQEDFRVESGVVLDRDPASRTFGWYTNGSITGGSATFCISSLGEVDSVGP
jgi:hypothetical protein